MKFAISQISVSSRNLEYHTNPKSDFLRALGCTVEMIQGKSKMMPHLGWDEDALGYISSRNFPQICSSNQRNPAQSFSPSRWDTLLLPLHLWLRLGSAFLCLLSFPASLEWPRLWRPTLLLCLFCKSQLLHWRALLSSRVISSQRRLVISGLARQTSSIKVWDLRMVDYWEEMMLTTIGRLPRHLQFGWCRPIINLVKNSLNLFSDSILGHFWNSFVGHRCAQQRQWPPPPGSVSGWKDHLGWWITISLEDSSMFNSFNTLSITDLILH